MPEPRALTEYQTDHDLIVGMVRDLNHFGEDIRELKEGVNKKNDDHEGRIRINEKRLEAIESAARTWKLVVTSIFSVMGIALTVISLVIAL